MSRERILITGPGGRVGKHLLPLLRPSFALRLLDQARLVPEGDDEVIQSDIADLAAVREACRGVDVVLHLAAISDEADFHSKLLPVNLAGTYNVFEAARQAKVRQVIFASTGQTILQYPSETWVTPEMPARPSTVYACTKLFGEALARYYSDVHGMSMICIRLCNFQPPESPLLKEHATVRLHWCSPRDLAQLVTKSIQSNVKAGVFFGLSNNTGRFWDLSNAEQLLGYQPEDDGDRMR